MGLSTKILSIVAGAAVVAGLAFGTSVSAMPKYIASENGSATISKNQTVDGSAYLAGSSVSIDGTVEGDVFCAGSSVTVTGTVEGDLICAAQTIVVNGTVKGDVRLAASHIVLNGAVDGSATLAASTVTTSADFVLGSDITAMAGNVKIDGTVGRDAFVGAEKFSLEGIVDRDVEASVESLQTGDQATVKGQFVYTAPKEVSIPNGVVAGGNIVYNQPSSDTNSYNSYQWFGAKLVSGLVLIGVLVSLALLVSAVAPRLVRHASELTWAQFGLSVLVGLTFIIVAPIAAVILMATMFGLLAGMALMFAWLLVMLLASVPVAYFVGTQLVGSKVQNVIGRAVLGALVLGVLMLVPVLNFLVALAVVFAGSGMLIMHMKHQYGARAYSTKSEKPKTKKVAKKRK